MGERVQRNLWLLPYETSSQQMAHGGRLLEAVSGESARAPEAAEVIDRAQDRLMVGRHLVEACPGGPHTGGTERGRSALDDISHGFEHGPIDLGVEAASRWAGPCRRAGRHLRGESRTKWSCRSSSGGRVSPRASVR